MRSSLLRKAQELGSARELGENRVRCREPVLYYRGLPPAPKPTKEQTDAIAFDTAWRTAGSRRFAVVALAADDAAEIAKAWRDAGTSRAKPRDPDVGLTPEERAVKLAAAHAAETTQKECLAKDQERWLTELFADWKGGRV